MSWMIRRQGSWAITIYPFHQYYQEYLKFNDLHSAISLRNYNNPAWNIIFTENGQLLEINNDHKSRRSIDKDLFKISNIIQITDIIYNLLKKSLLYIIHHLIYYELNIANSERIHKPFRHWISLEFWGGWGRITLRSHWQPQKSNSSHWRTQFWEVSWQQHLNKEALPSSFEGEQSLLICSKATN